MRLIDADVLLEQMKHRRDYVGRASDAICLVEDAPTVEAENALILMVLQYCTDEDGYLWNCCMTAGEAAFRVLGVKNGDSADGLWAKLEGEEKKCD